MVGVVPVDIVRYLGPQRLKYSLPEAIITLHIKGKTYVGDYIWDFEMILMGFFFSSSVNTINQITK